MQPRERFVEIARRIDGEVDLAEAALWIAAEAYPGLDVPHYLARLDALASEVEGKLRPLRTPPERVGCLSEFLFGTKGFEGNRADYYDPRNSFLNEVLDRRTGIPISLAVVYMEVARRAGLRVEGIGFPGHFLMKTAHAGGDLVIDPFSGELLDRDACEARLRATLGEEAVLRPAHLETSHPREILARMLTNLKVVYAGAGHLEEALGCCERILCLRPDDPGELRDRGLLYEQLECHAAALADLERFLTLAPDDPSAPRIRALLPDLRHRRLH